MSQHLLEINKNALPVCSDRVCKIGTYCIIVFPFVTESTVYTVLGGLFTPWLRQDFVRGGHETKRKQLLGDTQKRIYPINSDKATGLYIFRLGRQPQCQRLKSLCGSELEVTRKK